MRKKRKIKKMPVLERITDALEIPKETVMNIPLISLTGNKDVMIENFSNILEYGEERIRLNTKSGVVAIEGKKLEARSMTSETIRIRGYIESISFIK